MMNAMAAIGAIRENAQTVEAQIANLERDSFSDDPELNSEVSVLNKINATNVLTLRTRAGLEQTSCLATGTTDPCRQATTGINSKCN